MRLLSFLTDIETSLRTEAAANNDSSSWSVQRLVNFHQNMARMTVSASEGQGATRRGSFFLQSFTVSDGSFCVKACLQWDDCEATSVIAVYAKPALDWKNAATRIASAWLAGPAEIVEVSTNSDSGELAPLVAAVG